MAKQQMETKFGLVRAAAIAEAVRTLIPKLKGKWAKAARAAGGDFDSGAMEGICLAWASWDEARGPWLAHAYRYAEEYARREATKASSVVSTNYSRRTVRQTTADDSLSVGVDVDSGPVDVADYSTSPEAEVMARHDLSALYSRINEVLADLDPDSSLGKLAPEIVASWLNDGDNAGAIGLAGGYSRLTGYRSADALREALREALADVM